MFYALRWMANYRKARNIEIEEGIFSFSFYNTISSFHKFLDVSDRSSSIFHKFIKKEKKNSKLISVNLPVAFPSISSFLLLLFSPLHAPFSDPDFDSSSIFLFPSRRSHCLISACDRVFGGREIEKEEASAGTRGRKRRSTLWQAISLSGKAR